MPIAITRAVSASFADCELTWLPRQPVDIDKAVAQHHEYERCLAEMGAHVISLHALEGHPDAVFVEDPALVLDEVAIIATMGCESRRGERESLANELSKFRPVRWMRDPVKLEGGDVMRIGRRLFVGLSARTNEAGVAQLSDETAPFGYSVTPMNLRDCLHLKSACCPVGGNAILINRDWVDWEPLREFDLIDVVAGEPWAANVLRIGDTVLMPSSYPATAAILRAEGYKVRTVDLSELLKAESGVTCSSLVFRRK